MSPSSLRVVAAGLAAIVAVLTGVLTGFAGAAGSVRECTQYMVQVPEPVRPGMPTETKPPEFRPDRHVCEEPATFSAEAAVTGFVGAGLAGGALTVLLVLATRPQRRRPVAPATGAHPVLGADPARVAALEADRAILVKTAVYVRDRANSKAITDRIGWALAEVGVNALSPVGVRFDPAQHEAGGSAPTADPGQNGIIAAVEAPGYADRGTVLRAPVVTVYRQDRP